MGTLSDTSVEVALILSPACSVCIIVNTLANESTHPGIEHYTVLTVAHKLLIVRGMEDKVILRTRVYTEAGSTEGTLTPTAPVPHTHHLYRHKSQTS